MKSHWQRWDGRGTGGGWLHLSVMTTQVPLRRSFSTEALARSQRELCSRSLTPLDTNHRFYRSYSRYSAFSSRLKWRWWNGLMKEKKECFTRARILPFNGKICRQRLNPCSQGCDRSICCVWKCWKSVWGPNVPVLSCCMKHCGSNLVLAHWRSTQTR